MDLLAVSFSSFIRNESYWAVWTDIFFTRFIVIFEVCIIMEFSTARSTFHMS